MWQWCVLITKIFPNLKTFVIFKSDGRISILIPLMSAVQGEFENYSVSFIVKCL